VQSSQIFLRKNKEKQSIAQFENIESSFAESFRELSELSAESFQNFAESFKNISLSEKTRDEISKVILQKLKNRHSKAFKDHRKSSHLIISFSSSEVEITRQQQQNRFDQNIQKMIQAMIREMMSEIIQQSVAATVNVTATNQSDSSTADHL
jgi:superfamily I DNA and RNA helicase